MVGPFCIYLKERLEVINLPVLNSSLPSNVAMYLTSFLTTFEKSRKAYF